MGPKRRITQLPIAPLLAALCATAGAEPMDRAALLRLAPSVLKIEALGAGGRYQLGSGVIVGDGKVVTNCHVTRHAERISVAKNGVRWPVSAQAADALRDLCLLRVPGIAGDAAAIVHADSLKLGQPLMAIGYTGGATLQTSGGSIVALHEWSGSKVIQSSNWFNSGASGGGLFNAEGALVGILTFRLRGGAAHYFAAPADWLLGRLEDERRYQPVAPLADQAFWEEPPERQPWFLQAAALEQAHSWEPLARLAETWARQADEDPEPAYLLGVAYDGLGRTEASLEALRRCLALEPGFSRGWSRLADIYKRQGRLDDARAALHSLAALDPERASELSNELETR
jgi:hypothetical protein